MRVAGAISGFLVLGTFVIPGTYEPNMEIASAAPSWFQSRVVSSGELEEGSARLSGVTFDDRGRPLGGATISLAGSGFWPARSVTTGADGRFDWPEIPAGIYELRASKGPLVAPAVEGLILDAGSMRAFGMRLAEGWTLAGKVIDAQSGRSLEDAEVTVASGALGLHTRQIRSDSDGKFELAGIVGDQMSLYVEADGYVAAGPLQRSSAEPLVTVRLERASAIEGRVMDEAGRPIAGAFVRAFGEGETRPALSDLGNALAVTAGPVPPISAAGTAAVAFVREVESDRDGRFRVPQLQHGSYTLAATHDQFAATESTSIRVAPGGEHSGVTLVMRPGAELAGRVVDERGDGLEGIPVELRSADERIPRMTVTASDGSFSFRGVRGELSVTALPYDLPAVREAVAMDDDALVTVELALSSTLYTLHGRVVDERGFGIGGAHLVVLSKLPGSDLRRSAKSDADGTFSVPALPPPPFELSVEHPAYGPSRLPAVDTMDDVHIVMSAGVNLLGEVRDGWTGDALGSVLVEITGPIKRQMRSRSDGSFEFPRSPTGTYEVSFSHSDYESQIRRVVLEAPRYVDRPQELDTVRLEPGGSIEGEILDSRSEPVPGAEVAWGDPPRWERATRSDRRGHFFLRGVPAGAISITARHPVAGEAWSDDLITVRPLETSPGAYLRLPKQVTE